MVSSLFSCRKKKKVCQQASSCENLGQSVAVHNAVLQQSMWAVTYFWGGNIAPLLRLNM